MAANFIRHSRHRNAWSPKRSVIAGLARRPTLQKLARKTRLASSVMSDKPSFFAELKRRNVYKVAVAYAVISWLLIQAASILLPTFEAPAWVMKILVVLLALGFVFAVFISWAFEMTPQGMKRTADISPDQGIP